MISKCFVKLGIIVYFWILLKIWSKDDSYIIEVYYLTILWKRLEERVGEMKNRKSSFNFTFGQSSCLTSNFARPNSNKAVLVQIFLRFAIVIFKNNFVFCIMKSICIIAAVSWQAGWILAREIIKWTNVFHPVCLRKYWKELDKHLCQGLFRESRAITHHSLLKTNQAHC